MKQIIFYFIILTLYSNNLFSNSTGISSNDYKVPKWIEYLGKPQIRTLYPKSMPLVGFYSIDLDEYDLDKYNLNEDINKLSKHFINEVKLQTITIILNGVIMGFIINNNIYDSYDDEEYRFKLDKYSLALLPYLEEKDLFFYIENIDDKYIVKLCYLFLIDDNILVEEVKKIIDKLAIDFNHRTVSKKALRESITDKNYIIIN